MTYQRGDIVLVADVVDPNGVNPKDRPVLLIEDADAGMPLYGVAITSVVPQPLPLTHFVLPWHRQGQCRTGLTKPSVAVITWIVELEPQHIHHRFGVTPPRVLDAIMDAVEQYLNPPESDAATPPTSE